MAQSQMVNRPGQEPPRDGAGEMTWRLAERLHRDHGEPTPLASEGVCRSCGQPWPCSGRRLAELGLKAAHSG